jgi:hypothetical protein
MTSAFFESLPDDRILKIDAECFEPGLFENQVTLNGLKCEQLQFQNTISYTRVGALLCKPPNSLVSSVISSANQTWKYANYISPIHMTNMRIGIPSNQVFYFLSKLAPI